MVPTDQRGVRHELAFLDLLQREAPAADFDQLAAELLTAGEGKAHVEAARGAALRVRALLERRQRRDNELTALYDTANDLASLQDLDAVLRSIAQRARRLLHCDVAYLSLVDDARAGTYIRVADGSISPKLQNLRLDLGVGIGGVVARGAQTFQSADYLADRLLEHDRVVDEAVTAEGLVGIIGVPLLVAGQVIGVLFAADRQRRSFAAEEAALMSSLANHAALAIEKTRLLQDATTAIVELHRANDTIQANVRAVERAAEAHERLTELALRGGGVADVAASVVGVLGGSLLVVDAEGRVIATAGPSVEEATPVLDSALLMAGTVRSVQVGDWCIAPVAAGSDRLGALLLQPGSVLADGDRRVLERAAMVTALLLVWRRSVAEAEIQGRGDLLRDILSASGNPPALHERCRQVGVDLHATWTVLVMRADDRRQLLAAAAYVAPVATALIGESGADVVLVVPVAEPQPAQAAALARAVRARVAATVTVGVAGPATGVSGVRECYEEAERCVGALMALGRVGDLADARELGFFGVLLSDRRDVPGFLGDALGPVIEYDERRGSDLVGTLRQYFASDRSISQAAVLLHVHPNTVTQRLERVSSLLGADWKTAQGGLQVQLALELHRLRQEGVLED